MDQKQRNFDRGAAGAGTRAQQPRGLGWRLALARTAVAWERIWPRLWPAAAVLTLFLALALLGLLPMLGPWGHAAALSGLAIGFAAALWRGLRGLRWPGPDAAKRRLERDSGLAHRPLSGLDDRLAGSTGDAGSAALWRVHQERLRDLLGRLRVRPPRGSLAGVDPMALRAVPVLLLAAGLLVAGGEAPQRLLRAATPDLAGPPPQPPTLDVWIDPPAYTGVAPQFVATGEIAEPVLRAPVGSRLLVQLQGGHGAPVLRLGESEAGFERVADDAWKAERALPIDAGPRIEIVQAQSVLAGWDLHVVPDQGPHVTFRRSPQASRRNTLRVDYAADDDYGLAAVRLRVSRPGDERVAPIQRDLPLPNGEEPRAENVSYHDLTAHVWAGLEVEMTLVAEDAIGQTGHSDSVRTVLPERTFQHPVARKLVELRRKLTLNPENRYPVVQGLARLQRNPHRFFGDIVVALALRSAERRLVYDKTDAALPGIQELMWRTALRIEEGEIAIAERDLRQAEQALMEALSRDDVSEEELQRLMDDLEAAMDRFLQALAEHMRRQLAEGQQPQTLPEDAEIVQSQQLREMLERMRDMARSGARDAAREMLSRLQEIMENLSRQPMMGAMSEQARQAMEMMRQLRSLSERQQDLLNKSFERTRRDGGRLPNWARPERQFGDMPTSPGQPGRQDGPEGRSPEARHPGMLSDAERQDALRRSLGRLMRDLAEMLGEIPQPLGQAEQDMRGASQALRDGAPESAIQPQGDALDNLQEGMQAMREAIQQRMQAQQSGQGQGQGQFGWSPGQRQDPLGRARDRDGEGRVDTGDVRIPGEMELRRAREILDELRRRAGERGRPELELDYIERLLRRF